MKSVPEDGNQNLCEKVASRLQQLRVEAGLLERVIYKGKNQHRRCHYFKSVLKVKRDLTLLLHSGVEDIFHNMFHIINEQKPTRRVRLLDKMDRNAGGRCNIHERLLGVARLLSEMAEPITVAAVQISCLLARSYFMGYSLLLLSLLARTRVLLQQLLLDSVLVFNMVSDISQKRQVVKVNEDGLQAYREYHPRQRKVIKLQCIWEKDKFNLHETFVTHDAIDDDRAGLSFMEAPIYLYERLSDPIEGLDNVSQQILEDCTDKPESSGNRDENVAASMDEHVESIGDIEDKYNEKKTDKLEEDTAVSAKVIPCPTISQSEPSKKVAFVSVRKTTSFQAEDSRPSKLAKQSGLFGAVEGDPFFNLLAAGCTKENPSS